FLAGSDAWRTIGHPPSQDPILSTFGGTLTERRNQLDQAIGSLSDQNFAASPPLAGGYSVVIDKPGPRITLIVPSAARLPVLSVTPRMLISIYGTGLAGSTVTVNGQPLALNYDADAQINALLPDNVSGLARLTVTNASGQQSVNILFESAVPAIFT